MTLITGHAPLTRRIGGFVLGVALLIGTVGKIAPHLFLNLPFPLSIILWVSTGHDMPPYLFQDAFKEDEIDTWTKDGDLIVATGFKSGTTWMLYCTHQIRTKGTDVDDELFPDVAIATPWMDMRQSRAGSWAEQKERYNTTVLPDGRRMKDIWDHPSHPFRIFKSHYAPPILPVTRKGGNKLKYMVVSRNGIDVAASASKFYTQHSEPFRKLWGGFPPVIHDDALSADEPPAAVKDILPGGPLDSFYFGYVKSWWKYRNEPNVIMMHYSDLRKDLKGSIKKIAKFLEVDLNGSQLKKVTERCSIDHMKKVNRFLYKMPLNQDKGHWDPDDSIITPGGMINKGGVGTGGSIFSDKVVAQWKKAEEDQFGHNPAMLKWAREGGQFPPG